MVVMTDGLRALAGKAMRVALMRFTQTPWSGTVTGAVVTAILQSSSATIVATVGFVSAGVMGFTAALGVVFGANLGTTATGWLVALLGFKFRLGNLVMPLIFIGTALKLFSKPKLANAGYALAGFGLIFVGIATMQTAMDGMAGVITPDRLPPASGVGLVQLISLGLVTTLITQSSSAGVAATLTALHAGSVNFVQAAALVIGMDVGTTVTAVLAALGGSVNAQRTAAAHVVYNLWAALLGLLLLPAYLGFWGRFVPGGLPANPEVALVGFHTAFNVVGVATILPLTRPFARLITQLIPSRGPAYTEGLSESLLAQPELALAAAQRSMKAELLALVGHLQAILEDRPGQRVDLGELQAALDETHVFLDKIHLETGTEPNWERLINLIHALDHLQRELIDTGAIRDVL
ncbi:MAG TPA: Na/Pi cotransporter family protein, partial [Leptolyngbyaceae cyanobacterium M65_K2018_010]|nr:Na/Pi cotransporter family protein [Leptolyngbyaceae cyanobacterium M65_K2018_010]